MMFQAWASATNMNTVVSRRWVPGAMSCCRTSIAANAATPRAAGHELDGLRERTQASSADLLLRPPGWSTSATEFVELSALHLQAPAVERLSDQAARPDDQRDDQHRHRDRVDPGAGQHQAADRLRDAEHQAP